MNIDPDKAFRLERTPSRFGRVTIALEPLENKKGWKLDFNIEPGPEAEKILLPLQFMGRKIQQIEGAKFETSDRRISVDPHIRRWTAIWSES
jgi:hypothetical protein